MPKSELNTLITLLTLATKLMKYRETYFYPVGSTSYKEWAVVEVDMWTKCIIIFHQSDTV